MTDILASERYAAALAWARGLHAPGTPLDFPEEAEYIRRVIEEDRFAPDDFDELEAKLRDLPEEYELAYLTVKLERMKEKVRREQGIDPDNS